jgi:hypothetical protein
MGKGVAGQILMAVVIAAVVFFTAGGAAAGAAAWWAAAASLAASLATIALTPRPKKNTGGASSDGGSKENISLTVFPWIVAYGTTLVDNIPIFDAAISQDTKYLYMIQGIAAHEIKAVDGVYFNDDFISIKDIDGDGNVTAGRYAGIAKIRFHLGADDQSVDPLYVSSVPTADNNARFSGIAYAFITLTYNRDIFYGTPRTKFLVRGKKVKDYRDNSTIFTENSILIAHDYLVNKKFGVGCEEYLVDVDFTYTGANVCEEFVAVDSTLPANKTTTNSIDHTKDCFYLNTKVSPFVTGDRVQLTGSVPTGTSTGTNYYVIVVQPRSSNPNNIVDYPIIKLATSYQNALDHIAINITSNGSGSINIIKNAEPRYSFNGYFLLGNESDDATILNSIKETFAGDILQTGDRFRLLVGAYTGADLVFTDDNVVGDYNINCRTPLRERANLIRGTFKSPIYYDSNTEYPQVDSETYLANDNGVVYEQTLELSNVVRPATCQRIARIALEKMRRELTYTITLDILALRTQIGDTIMIDSDYFGFDNKTFRVEDWVLRVEQQEESLAYVVDMTLKEHDASIYSWNPITDELELPIPERSNLPNPFTVENPSSLTLDSGDSNILLTSDGVLISRILANWTAPLNPNVTNYEFGYKLASETKWNSIILDRTSTSYYIAPVKDGETYDVRIRTINGFGNVLPSYTSNLGHVVIGKTSLPPRPTSFTFVRLSDGTRRFEFDLTNAPADVRVGGGFKIKYFTGSTSDWSAMTDLHTGVLKTSPYETNDLAAGVYTFACKAVDSSGNESATALFINNIEMGNPRLNNSIYQQSEAPLWTGTKTNCFVDSTSGYLYSTSTQNWSNLPATWNDLTNTWDTILTNNNPITYETDVIDLGIDVSFVPLVTVTANGTAVITAKFGSEADGTVVGSYASITGQVNGKRYAKFKVVLTDSSGTPQPYFQNINIIFDANSKNYEYNDLNTATEPSSNYFQKVATGHFKIAANDDGLSKITQAKIEAIQNVAFGWSWVLISKNTTITSSGYKAAEFKIYNAAGTLSDATVDIVLKGITTV